MVYSTARLISVCVETLILLRHLVMENDIPPKTKTNAVYADDLTLLTNTLVQAKLLLHSLEQAAGGIVLYVNANETEYMYFK